MNRRQNLEVPLHNQKTDVWCGIAATRIVGLILVLNTVNSKRYVSDNLLTFFESKIKCIQIIPTHLINLSKVFVKRSRLSRSVN
jgi:hypothetical protein